MMQQQPLSLMLGDVPPFSQELAHFTAASPQYSVPARRFRRYGCNYGSTGATGNLTAGGRSIPSPGLGFDSLGISQTRGTPFFIPQIE